MRRGILLGGVLALGTGILLWRGVVMRPHPEQKAQLRFSQGKGPGKTPAVRSIIELSGHERDGSHWIAVWCYLPRVRVRTVYTWRHNQSVRERLASLARGESTPLGIEGSPFGSGSLSPGSNTPRGDEWAVLNGGYFDWNRQAASRRAIIGSVGNRRAGTWSHSSPPSSGGKRFQRWAFGLRQHGGETRFGLALMQQRAGIVGYRVPAAVENAFPYGLSGLLCLMQNGQAQVWRDKRGLHALPEGQWNGRTEFLDGYFRRAALAWSADGRSLFLLVHTNPRSVLATRDLFARYTGKRYTGPGPVLAALRVAFLRLPLNARPCSPNALPRRLTDAVMLDGGHCAGLLYRRHSAGLPSRDWGSLAPSTPLNHEPPRVPTTLEVSER